MKILKRCPFCNKFVWFWQSKCYLDAKSKKPCHAYCWVWEMAKPEQPRELVEVQDDSWKRGVEK